MKVLVTGATGFIGINLVKALVQQGRPVVGLYRTLYEDYTRWYLGEHYHSPLVTWVEGDITSDETMEELTGLTLGGIIHSAVITPSPAVESSIPETICDVNYMGTVKLLGLARRSGIERFLYVSSSGVFGSTGDDRIPVPEERAADLYNLYTISKFSSERTVARYSELFGLKTASARIGAPFGPGERRTRSREIMGPIYEMVTGAAAGRTVKLANPSIGRDWTHVNDTCDALIALYDAMPLPHQLYNVSLGKSYSLWDVAREVEKHFSDASFEEVADASQAQAAMSLNNMRGPLDINRLRQDTGFKPSYDLPKAIADYTDWLLKYKEWNSGRDRECGN